MQHNNQNTNSSLENALNNTGVQGNPDFAGNQTFNQGASTTGAVGGVGHHNAHGHHQQHPATNVSGTGSGSFCDCVPGAPDCTHKNTSRGNMSGACGCAPGSTSCTHQTGSHGHDAHHQSGTKPSMGDKIAGTVQEAMGKVQKDPAKETEGAIRKTEGKAALDAGIDSANAATGPGRM